MSGILGIFNLDSRPIDPDNLNRMVNALSHRGPDRQGVWVKDSISFGHCMLWNTPESLKENLPFIDESGMFSITSDARIDNREELVAALGFDHRRLWEISDSELILSAYKKWEDGCPFRLLGDFAFAIWDERRQALFCARDIAGIKPFYYYHSSKMFAFASEYQALLKLPVIPHQINDVAIADYLGMVLEETDQTLYKEIMQLPGSFQLSVNQEGLNSRRYWSLDPTIELKLRSDDEYADGFREIFTEAVRCRIRSVFPIGSTLSGGLDSSSIVCISRDLLKDSRFDCLNTFSVVFPTIKTIDPRSDESEYQQAVIAGGDLNHYFINADKFCSLSEEFIAHYNHIPLVNMYVDWLVFKAAKDQGARVVLSGTDGDTTVDYGFWHLEDLFRSGKWIRLFREVNELARMSKRGRKKIIWRYALEPTIPRALYNTWRNLKGINRVPWDSRSLIKSEFAQKVLLAERIREHQNSFTLPKVTKCRQAHWQGLRAGLWANLIESVDDLATNFSVEVRYPFFDRRLIEYCLALPGNQKLRNGWTRYILRNSMQGILPSEVQWRTGKGSLAVNTSLGLFEHREKILEPILFGDGRILEEYVDLQALRNVYQRFLLNPTKNVNDAFIVFWNIALTFFLLNN